jgi:transcriptional regulator with XRE-family HTH domain
MSVSKLGPRVITALRQHLRRPADLANETGLGIKRIAELAAGRAELTIEEIQPLANLAENLGVPFADLLRGSPGIPSYRLELQPGFMKALDRHRATFPAEVIQCASQVSVPFQRIRWDSDDVLPLVEWCMELTQDRQTLGDNAWSDSHIRTKPRGSSASDDEPGGKPGG